MVDLVPLERYRGADRRALFEDLTHLSALLVPVADFALGRFVTGTWVWPGERSGPARGVAVRLAVGLPDVGPVREGLAETFDPAAAGATTEEAAAAERTDLSPEPGGRLRTGARPDQPPLLPDQEGGVLDGGRLADGTHWVTLLIRLTPDAEPTAVQITAWQHPGRTAIGATVVLLAPRLDPRPHQDALLAAAERLQDATLPRRARISLVSGLAVMRRAVSGSGLDGLADEEVMKLRVLKQLAAQLPADAEQRSLGVVRLPPVPGAAWWDADDVATLMPESPDRLQHRPVPAPRSIQEQVREMRPEPPKLTRRQLVGALVSRVLGGAIAGIAGFAAMMAVVTLGLPSRDGLRLWGTLCLVLGGALILLGLVLSGLLEWRRRRTHPAVTALTGVGGFLLVVAATTPVAVDAR